MKIQQLKSQKMGQRWISCLKEPTFCQKSQLVKLAKNLEKAINLRQTLTCIGNNLPLFGTKVGPSINPSKNYPPLDTNDIFLGVFPSICEALQRYDLSSYSTSGLLTPFPIFFIMENDYQI